MSNRDTFTELSQKLGEPGWLLSWRASRQAQSETLPENISYGIGIRAVLPEYVPTFSGSSTYSVDASKGVELYTWKEAFTQEEIAPIVRSLMESDFFPRATNKFSAVGQAFFSSALVVYVQPKIGDDGVLQNETLTLDTHLADGATSDIVIVIAKEGARLAFHSTTSGGGAQSLFARTVIVLTERDAHVTVTEGDTCIAGTTLLVANRAIVGAHARVEWNACGTSTVYAKRETENHLVGKSAHGEIRDGVIALGDARRDIYSSTIHKASESTSRIQGVGVVFDKAKIIYRGLIDMAHGVHDVRGSQEAKFFVSSNTAGVDAIPSLDIASKDVVSTHKLSVQHIRPGDTFYPRLHGLSEDESKSLYILGAFTQVFGEKENDAIMTEIEEKLTQVQFS